MSNPNLDITFEQLERSYGIKKKEASAFVVMLSLLEVGKVFKTPLGVIERLSNDTYRIELSAKDLEDLALALDPFDSVTIDDAIFRCQI